MIIEDDIKIGDPLTDRGIHMEVGDPLTEEDTPVEDPLMVEQDPLDLLKDKDLQALKDPWTSETYNSPNPSSALGYNGFGKHF